MMDEKNAQGGPSEAIPPPKKRSFFNVAAVAKAREDDNGIAFFSRAKELQAHRLQEEERRRQRKKVKEERKRSSASVDRRDSTPPGKKRKVSRQPEGEDRYSSERSVGHDEPEGAILARRGSTQSPAPSRKSEEPSTHHKIHTSMPAMTLSQRYRRDLRNNQKPSISETVAKGYISISESDGDDEKPILPVKKSAAQSITVDDDETYKAPGKPVVKYEEDNLQLSDEEFPELIQLARERERQRELQRENAARSFKGKSHAPISPDLVDDDIFQVESRTPDLDPTIEILVTSMMEGTKPVKFPRKLSQRLQPVRHAWCDKQSSEGNLANMDLKSVIFLSWKNKRLFDSTTCLALGLKMDSNGQLPSSGEGILNGKVHFEAWTEDTFATYKKEQAAKQRKEEGKSNEEDAAEEQKEEMVRIRVIMKARDMEAFKLIVKPTTTIKTIVAAFRKARSVPESKEIELHFDGDKLDPTSTVEESDLGDMDSMDVHIR